MALKERLQASLADVNADIKRMEAQMSKVVLCERHEADYAAVFVNRDKINREMLQDLQFQKLDLERQLRELEEE